MIWNLIGLILTLGTLLVGLLLEMTWGTYRLMRYGQPGRPRYSSEVRVKQSRTLPIIVIGLIAIWLIANLYEVLS